MNIADIRAKFPQYDDMSDADLADALYSKFYADMPREEFDAKLSGAVSGKPGVVEDVAKAAGSGFVTGAQYLAGLPGDFQHQLGRLGGHVGDKLFGEATPEQQSKLDKTFRSIIPTSEQIGAANKRVTGFTPYEPQTTAGKFANTAAEFVPGAVAFGGGGTLRQMGKAALKYGVVPGISSEAAGQAALAVAPTLEPVARVAGAFAGPAALAAGKLLTPVRSSDATQRAAAVLRGEGVEVTAGQATGSNPLRYKEANLGGNKAAAFQERQAEQFTRAALKRVGASASRATPEVMDDAFKRIGSEFDRLAANNTLKLDTKAQKRIMDAFDEYLDLVSPNNQVPKVSKFVDDLTNPNFARNNTLSGEQYQSMRSSLDRAARRLSRSGDDAADALWDMRSALDDAMERSLTTKTDKNAWRRVRRQYRNIIPVEKALSGAGADTATGLISPSRLRSAVVQQNKRAFVRGNGDFADLARAGESVLKPLPQSGTAPHLSARMMDLNLMPGAVGGAIGGATGSWEGALAGAALGMGIPRVAGSAMLSGPGQRYLGNQMFTPVPGQFQRALMPTIANASIPARR